MFVVAHISDTHFNGTRVNRQRVESTLSYIAARADGINALLVSGDIADEGTLEQYREAFGVLHSPQAGERTVPMLITPGNHDVNENFSEVFLGAAEPGPLNSAQLIDGVLFVVADSSIPGRSDGHLSDETLAWMSAEIAAVGPNTPVIVVFHHPPATLGMPFMDTIMQTGTDRLADLVATHPNIVGFLCGHTHSGAVTHFAGRPLCVAPGVASTLNLPFEGDEILNRGQPPGIAFHLLDGQRLISHFRSVMF